MYHVVEASEAETEVLSRPRFPAGRLVATPGALAALEEAGISPLSLLARHLSGDWGDVPPADARLNDAALAAGDRLVSGYPVGEGVRVWVLTEADRSSTCLLLPEEY